MLTGLVRTARTLLRGSVRSKHSLDRSRVPVLREEDVVEQFVHGSGPGGQAVNKLSNCVVLRHVPTGVVVRCHESRLQHENRRLARELLVEKLDDLLNGDQSLSAQRLRRAQDRQLRSAQRKARLRQLRTQFKDREGLA
ncbi:unnamed protein product [Ixodes hexagonus]